MYGLDLISLTASGQTLVYHHDGLGSVQSLTDSAGALEWSYAYDPFGAPRRTTKHDLLASSNPMQFTGEYRVEQAGLYHLRAREYAPQQGRVHTLDPLPPTADQAYDGSYNYVRNRATSFVDPSGLRGSGVQDNGFSFGGWWRNWRAGFDLTPMAERCGKQSCNCVPGPSGREMMHEHRCGNGIWKAHC